MLTRLASIRGRRGIALAAGLAVTVAIVIGVLAAVGLLPGLDGGRPAVAQFPPRPYTADDFWPEEQGVLVVLLPDDEMAPGGTVDPQARDSIWFDPRRGRAYIEIRALDGGLREAAGVDGGVYWKYRDVGYFTTGEYRGDAGYLDIVRRTAPGDAWNRWMSVDGGWHVGYHPAVREGELKALLDTTEIVMNGREVLEVKVPFIGESGDVEEVFTIYLDPLSGMPADYVIEWLPVEAVDPALFAVPEDLPPIRTLNRDIELTVQEAREFKAFDVYYLGQSVNGQSLLLLTEFERVYGADWSDPSDWPPTHYVRAVYGAPGVPGAEYTPALSITSDPDHLIQAPWEEDPPMPRPGGPGRQVTVAGVPGVIFETPGDATLWFQLGGTVITISGEDSQQVLSAAESLEKLN
jgi:hypothetical protein